MKIKILFSDVNELEEPLHCITTEEDLAEFLEQLEGAGCRFSRGHSGSKTTIKVIAKVEKLTYDRQGSSHVKNRQNKILFRLKDYVRNKSFLVDLSCSYFDYSPNL